MKTMLALLVVSFNVFSLSSSRIHQLHEKQLYMSHPWHGIPVGSKQPQIVNTVIEISQGMNTKYQTEHEYGILKLDRVIYSPVFYPVNYGFIPQTLGKDNDPLDIMLISSVAVVPSTLVEAKIIGVMKMIDTGEVDDKIIGVIDRDMAYNQLNDIFDVNNHTLNQIRRFFEDYKKLENKTVTVSGFASKSTAQEIVKQAINAYKYTYGMPQEFKK